MKSNKEEENTFLIGKKNPCPFLSRLSSKVKFLANKIFDPVG